MVNLPQICSPLKRKKSFNNSAQILDYNEVNRDVTDCPEAFAEDYRRSSLLNSSNGKILLACGWTTDEARRKFDMFPELLSGDDTEQTNSEERPLFTLCGKDSMNQTFAHTWVFMPSKSQWVYNWIFENCLVTLHPGTALERVHLFATDADQQETRAAESACGRGQDKNSALPNARHRHCAWHKINRNFTDDSEYKSKLISARKKDWKASIEIDVLIRWLWYFVKYYETAEEVNIATQLLHLYMNEDQSCHHGVIDETVRVDIRNFLSKSFFPNRVKLFESEFSGLRTLGNCTTSINEAENRVYKNHCCGPRPQHNLAETANRITKLNKLKEERKSRKIAADMRGTMGKITKREQMDDRLTDYANKQLIAQYSQRVNYFVYKSEQNVFWVKRKNIKVLLEEEEMEEGYDLPTELEVTSYHVDNCDPSDYKSAMTKVMRDVFLDLNVLGL